MSAPYRQTLRDRIRLLPERFRSQYVGSSWWENTSWCQAGSARMVFDRLMRIDLETCTLADLSNIAAFLPGWVRGHCDGCRWDTDDDLVVLNDEPDRDFEEPLIHLCRDCAHKAAGVFLIKSA